MMNANTLPLERCTHCGIARPRLNLWYQQPTTDSEGHGKRFWTTYICSTCGVWL